MSEASSPTMDEHKIARAVSLGLPLVTVLAAGIVGVVVGPATSILVVAAGLLLGVIAILWGSIRVLSGDAPLPPELEDLDMHAHADALTSRKKMLLRALKDLENERAIGKLEADDFDQIAAQYRTELRKVLTRLDESLAPNRALAEEAAREHLLKAGVGKEIEPEATKAKKKTPKTERIECPKCNAKNEPDAKFCKECAAKLGSEKAESRDA